MPLFISKLQIVPPGGRHEDIKSSDAFISATKSMLFPSKFHPYCVYIGPLPLIAAQKKRVTCLT